MDDQVEVCAHANATSKGLESTHQPKVRQQETEANKAAKEAKPGARGQSRCQLLPSLPSARLIPVRLPVLSFRHLQNSVNDIGDQLK